MNTSYLKKSLILSFFSLFSCISISVDSQTLSKVSESFNKNTSTSASIKPSESLKNNEKIVNIPDENIFIAYKTPDIRKISGWNISDLDTGKDLDNKIEKDVLLATNMARTNPSKFSDDFLLPLLNSFELNSNTQVIDGVRIKTNEGKSAIKEAIKFLQKQKPIKSLTYKSGMRLAALDHVKNQGKTELTGHDDADGSTPSDRLKRYGKCGNYCGGENIDYGSATGISVVVGFIVDDGVDGRGHRDNIFDENYNFTGVACGEHKGYRTMCVQDFAGEYE